MGVVARLIQRIVVLVAAVLVAGAAAAQQTPTRVALVIGNGDYEAVPVLANPLNDSGDVGDALSRLGFDVTRVADATQGQLRRALQDFELKVAGAEIAVVFYAGHGIEIAGVNYLIPTDARLARDTHVADEAIPLDRVLTAVERASVLGLVILDACRDNPFAALMQMSNAGRSVGRGLARVEPSGSTMVVYAAKEGTIADDGDGDNSPFTKSLLANLETPGLEVGFLFRLVRDDVIRTTGGSQEPVIYSSLGGVPIFLLPAVVVETPVPVAGPSAGGDSSGNVLSAYQAAVAINTVEAWDAFLRYFGTSGYYGELAQAARNKLVSPGTTVVSNPPAVADTPLFVTDLPDGPSPAGGRSEAARRCDALAAYEWDPDRPADLEPVAATMVRANLVAAREACRQAVLDHPGDARLLSQLGRVHAVGDEDAEALAVYLEAAALGGAMAMNELGLIYRAGDGVAQDLAEARRWFELAAEAGSTDAMANLGYIYEGGQGVAVDYAEARRWFQRAADGGNPEGFAAIAFHYVEGLGVPVDLAEARVWYAEAADLGNAYALNALGYLYDWGLGGPTDLDLARDLYEQAAELGNADAINNLGLLYEDGAGVDVDYERARGYYERAAAAGNSFGMYNLGRLYQDGLGVNRDYARAVRWYEQAADIGHGYAMNRLGLMYDNGWGVVQDVAAARAWWEQSAAAGIGDAYHNLGYLYEIGRGVDRSLARATDYYIEALALKNAATIEEFTGHAMSYSLAVRRAVEQFLSEQGLATGPVDGKMDDATMAALAAWGEE